MKREPMAHKPETLGHVLWEGLWFVVSCIALVGIIFLAGLDNVR